MRLLNFLKSALYNIRYMTSEDLPSMFLPVAVRRLNDTYNNYKIERDAILESIDNNDVFASKLEKMGFELSERGAVLENINVHLLKGTKQEVEMKTGELLVELFEVIGDEEILDCVKTTYNHLTEKAIHVRLEPTHYELMKRDRFNFLYSLTISSLAISILSYFV